MSKKLRLYLWYLDIRLKFSLKVLDVKLAMCLARNRLRYWLELAAIYLS